MKKLVLVHLLFFLVLGGDIHAQILRKRTTMLMGGRFEISIVANDSITAERYVDEVIAEIARIENLISDWKSDSQVSDVNRNAGVKPVKVDREVFELTRRALELSAETGGAFDITFAAMDRIWKFDGSMTSMPTKEQIQQSVAKVGYEYVTLDSVASTIFLRRPGMKIGFGALGEGYATDRCRAIMQQKGVVAGIINGSGDMSTWGKQPNGKPWTIGLTDPFQSNRLFAVVPMEEGAVTTSGSYEKFVEFDGKRYSHIINPKTGYPATGLCSVTVFGHDAEIANGLSTSVMVLGVEKGVALLKRYPGYRYVIIRDDGTMVKSKKFRLRR